MKLCTFPDCTNGDTSHEAYRRCQQCRIPAHRYGLPADMTPGDVKAFFSLPDDDDRMHQQGAVEQQAREET